MHRRLSNPQVIALAVIVVGLVFLALFFRKTGILSQLGDLEQLRAYIQSFAPWSAVVFFFLQLTSVIVAPIPSNLMATVGGMCFGFLMGGAITMTAVILGSSITFSLARVLGQQWAERVIGQKLSPKYRELIERKRDSFLVLAFLFPFFPDDLLCILAGLTEIPFKRFLLIIVLTRPWGLLFAAGLGSYLPSIPQWALPLVAVGGVLLFVLGLKYGDRVEAALTRRLTH